ncbi:hypothetical protein NQ317_013402 [Molorchus minor]|uniref:Uncharacterized protein n=1 Tax=Molorchus minor TaxID=1323400 RepID=A0ABQ9IQB1_9CUCU|nr:hypothetical protein NQ317_013402 [Molorchus minor]
MLKCNVPKINPQMFSHRFLCGVGIALAAKYNGTDAANRVKYLRYIIWPSYGIFLAFLCVKIMVMVSGTSAESICLYSLLY